LLDCCLSGLAGAICIAAAAIFSTVGVLSITLTGREIDFFLNMEDTLTELMLSRPRLNKDVFLEMCSSGKPLTAAKTSRTSFSKGDHSAIISALSPSRAEVDSSVVPLESTRCKDVQIPQMST